MKKIKVRIQNYEILKDATIVVEGVTGIIGESNNGKTSIFRAIKSAFNNTAGNSYIRQGEKSCTVGVLFEEDNGKIVWRKGSSASYLFNGISMDKTGRSLPEMIETYLNMSPVVVDKDKIDINFLPQLEPPLIRLLTESKTYKLLVKSLDGDKISTAIELCEKDISSNNEKIKSKRLEHSIKSETALDIKNKLIRFQPLEKLKPAYELVRHLPLVLEKLDYIKLLLVDNSRSLISLNKEYNSFITKRGSFKDFDQFLETYSGYLDYSSTYKNLTDISNSLKKNTLELQERSNRVCLVEKLSVNLNKQRNLVSLIKIGHTIEALDKSQLFDRGVVSGLQETYTRISGNYNTIFSNRNTLNSLLSRRDNLYLIKEGLDVARLRLKEVNEEIMLYMDKNKCPLCGGVMNEESHFDLDLLNQKIDILRQKKSKLESEIELRDEQISKLRNEVTKLGYNPDTLDSDIEKIKDSLLVFEKEAEIYVKELEDLEAAV